MEEGLVQKEKYIRTSGLQEIQWSKGKNAVLAPPNFIETNLVQIENNQFLEGIAQRYGVSMSDLFPEYLSRKNKNGEHIKQSRVLLRQIENILNHERRYRFVIKGDSEEGYIYPLDGFEVTEESVIRKKEDSQNDIKIDGKEYDIDSEIVDRYTNRKYTILEDEIENIKILSQKEGENPELIGTKPFITEFEQNEQEYNSADFEFPMREEKDKPKEEIFEKIGFGEKIKNLFQSIFRRQRLKELPAPKQENKPNKTNKMNKYKVDIETYSKSPDEISQIAQKRLLEDLKRNGRKTNKEEGISR